MAYTKRTWSCGDKITADALNRIEQGIEDAYECCENGNFAIVHLTESGGALTADMTCEEMDAIVQNGGMLFVELEDGMILPLAQYNAPLTLNASMLRGGTLNWFTFRDTTVYAGEGVSQLLISFSSNCEIAGNEIFVNVSSMILDHYTDTTDPNDPVDRMTTTYSEIANAYLAGRAVLLYSTQGNAYYSMTGLIDADENGGHILFSNGTTWKALSRSDYPYLPQDI